MKWQAAQTCSCDTCGFELYLPIVESPAGSPLAVLGLYDDDRFPGRCILSMVDHYDHLDELNSEALSTFMRQAASVGGALRKLSYGNRINYAVMGNAHPHVHMHIIPRGSMTDLLPERPIWEDHRAAGRLESRVRDHLMEEIAETLGASSHTW